jgi:DNA polymerase III sliding clamp (beta) subunit (PCNA family)
MKIDRRRFHEAMKELVRGIDPKASVPILSHVLLQATAGVLTLTATDS